PGKKWLEEKHKTKRKRRSWRKLHLGLDLSSGEIICSDLTKDDVGDPTVLPVLLDQVDGPVSQFLAPFRRLQAKAYQAMDGAYDGDPTSDLLTARFGSTIEVTVPPPKNAILSPNVAKDPTARDRDIAAISSHERIAWQKATGYNQRSRVETLMGRWKGIVGPKLRARAFGNQKTEAKIGVWVLNRMTGLGRPSVTRIPAKLPIIKVRKGYIAGNGNHQDNQERAYSKPTTRCARGGYLRSTTIWFGRVKSTC
ncbi:MAG: transposase, partial [Pseudoruegeria sp.]